MAYSFFAMLSRMKNIYRWALMRNTRQENICEHSHEVAVLAHALALLTNRYDGGQVDPAQCVLLAVYHDVPEILTGDMPTPVKYYNPAIREAYRQVERSACDKLLEMLPAELQGEYAPLLLPGEDSLEGIYFRILRDACQDQDAGTVEALELAARISRQILQGREVELP